MYVSCLYHANSYFLLTYHIALVMEKEDHHCPATHSNNNKGNDYDMANHINYYSTNISNTNSHHHLHQHQQQMSPSGASSDRLSFADVMRFADFGPKLALNHTPSQDETTTAGASTSIETINPIYFIKVPVLNDDKLENHDEDLVMVPPPRPNYIPSNTYDVDDEQDTFGDSRKEIEEEISRGNNSVTITTGLKNKRKRPRSVKTSEEVESQRMTHIAVERNRRKQMNEHLRVLRSLMPSSYVQRGDQASIIGGAIEFVRELEQLLQCLESQKRRRIYGDNNQLPDSNNNNSVPNTIFGDDASMIMNNDVMKIDDMGHAREESAENKSCLADVEVKLLGFDAIIKILCRRRPGQLIKTIAALEDLQLNILHTNITTIEQTVLYSFNVKVASELRLNAEDIASSVQQIFTFIHASNI